MIVVTLLSTACKRDKSVNATEADTRISEISNKSDTIIMNNCKIKDLHEYKTYFKDQERVETEEKEVDNPYELSEKDLLITLPIIEEGLISNGYNPISESSFIEKIKIIFGLDLRNLSQNEGLTYTAENSPEYITIYGDEMDGLNSMKTMKFNLPFYTKNIFLSRRYRFLTETNLLSEVLTIENENTCKIHIEKKLIHRNKFLFNDSQASLSWLLSNDQPFLEQLVMSIGYDKDMRINKMVLENYYNRYTDETPDESERIGELFFQKDKANKLHIRKGLLDFVEQHTTATDNKFIDALGIYMYNMYTGYTCSFYPVNNCPFTQFTALEKAEIAAHIASIENPAFWKYKEEPGNKWSNTGTNLYNLSVSNPEVIDLIVKNNYFNIPNMKEVIENLEYEKGPDPE